MHFPAAEIAHDRPEAVQIVAQAPSRRHVPALDGLRGVAIIAVMLFKSAEGFHPVTRAGEAVGQIFGAGWAGVDLFFVLSGFLITGILIDSKRSAHFFRNFYARRTLRVFPLYYAMLLATFVVGARLFFTNTPGMQRIIHNQGWLWAYATNIAFLVKRSVFFDSGWIHLNHFWSLAIEEQFYLVWPVVVFVLSPRSLRNACLVFIAGALLMRVGLYFAHQRPGARFYPTPCRLDSLAFGGLIAVALRRPAGLNALLRPARLGAVLAGAGLAAVWIWRREFDVNDITTLTFGFTILACFAACILTLSLDPGPRNILRQSLENRSLRQIGKYSYAMYVLHMAIIYALDKHLPLGRMIAMSHWEALGMVLHAALVIAVTLAAAFASWHLFEKHFIRAKRFFPNQA